MATFDGTVVAVTGSTRGLGRGVAEAFVREGANVVINGRGSGAGEECLADLDANGRALFYAGDVCEQSTVEALIDFAVDRFGQLDVMVLNVGALHPRIPIAELSDDDWLHTINLNLNHVFWGMRRALQHMIPRRRGRILVTSAVEGKLGRPGASGYVAAKHGVNGLVKSAAQEVGTLGITVNAIVPGVLAPSASGERDDATAELIERSKTKRPNAVEEVAGVALMLASPSMTSITGCLFPVDGGAMPY
jgi:NAD(P)-dependent dehydrogenase (short-subunit alcohol dehydrogenase family)